jgi:hypothetical protein
MSFFSIIPDVQPLLVLFIKAQSTRPHYHNHMSFSGTPHKYKTIHYTPVRFDYNPPDTAFHDATKLEDGESYFAYTRAFHQYHAAYAGKYNAEEEGNVDLLAAMGKKAENIKHPYYALFDNAAIMYSPKVKFAQTTLLPEGCFEFDKVNGAQGGSHNDWEMMFGMRGYICPGTKIVVGELIHQRMETGMKAITFSLQGRHTTYVHSVDPYSGAKLYIRNTQKSTAPLLRLTYGKLNTMGPN